MAGRPVGLFRNKPVQKTKQARIIAIALSSTGFLL